MKICKKCSLTKNLNEFNKRVGSKDGFAYECRECSKKRGKEYYNKNEKKIKLYQKEYYQNNCEYIFHMYFLAYTAYVELELRIHSSSINLCCSSQPIHSHKCIA